MRVFRYTRGTGQGEQRLHRKQSVGIGGHISSDDAGGSQPYAEGMRRELDEEVSINTSYTDRCVGLINDDETDVGKVHLGVVHVFDVASPDVAPREKDIVDAGFRPLEELLADLDGFESWSRICLQALFGPQPVMLQLPVYLDNHATTRVDPRVLDAMLPYFREKYGNAGSTGHLFGWESHDAVEHSRRATAQTIHAEPREIVFTSGATESNNLALRGLADRTRRRGNHIVTVQTEHKAVLDPLMRLARRDFQVTRLPVAPHDSPQAGRLEVDQVAAAITDQTMLVSVMLANNEIGVLQPVAEIGALCRERGVLLHCDATQAVGRVPVDVGALQVDLLSFSAHKIYGPKGVGVLYVRRSGGTVRLSSQIDGGGQEGGLRSGTLNVPGIVGLARALQLCVAEFDAEPLRLAALRTRLLDRLAQEVPDLGSMGPS